MPIYINGKKATAIKRNGVDYVKVYHGEELVWQKESGKYLEYGNFTKSITNNLFINFNSSTDTIEIKLQYNASGHFGIGYQTGINNIYYSLCDYETLDSNNIQIGWGTSRTNCSPAVNKYELNVYRLTPTGCYVNDTQITNVFTARSIETDHFNVVGSYRETQGANNVSITKNQDFYYLKQFRNDELIKYFRPYMKNDVLGMMEDVSKMFYPIG